MKKLFVGLSLIVFVQQYVYADVGGVDVDRVCQVSAPCPSGQSGSISMTILGRNHMACIGVPWNNGVIISQEILAAGGSVNDVGYRLHKQFSGRVLSSSYNCVNNSPTYQSTKTESQKVECPLSQPVGSATETRTYEVWSDGSVRNYSAWTKSVSTCKAIPTTQTTSTPSSQTLNCDAYYNAPVGTYSGTVIKYGSDVTTYSSDTMTTSTIFTPTGNVDTTGCNNTNGNVEYKNEACDAGQTGTKVLYSYVTTVNGVKTYSPWEVFSSTCQASDEDSSNDSDKFKPQASVISNMSITSSDLINKALYNDFLSKVKSENFASGENHTLNIVIDDLSKNNYNAKKLTDAVNKFKNTVGENYSQVKIVSVPKDLTKYKGYEGLSNTSNKSFKSATVNSSNVVVLEYLDLSQKDNAGMPKTQTVNIPIFSSSMGGSIKSNDK